MIGFTSQESAALLKAIFPNYPELQPCNPVPEWYWELRTKR